MHAGAGARQLKHIILTARHSREWSSLALQATEDECHDACDEDDDDDPLPCSLSPDIGPRPCLPTSGAARTSPQHRSVLQPEA